MKHYTVSAKWPFISSHACNPPPKVTRPEPPIADLTLPKTVLADGRPAVIHHRKPRGLVGVRPYNPDTGRYYPNPHSAWTWEQKVSIPEELVLPE